MKKGIRHLALGISYQPASQLQTKARVARRDVRPQPSHR